MPEVESRAVHNVRAKHPERVSPRVRTLLAVLSALAVLWFNPIQSLTKYASEQFYFRALAYAYKDERPQVLLVIADDTALTRSKAGAPPTWTQWPLPLAAWASAVNSAVGRGAKMILIDVAFIDPRQRSEEDLLINTLRTAARQTDIFLINPGDNEQAGSLAVRLKKELREPRIHFGSGQRPKRQGLSDSYRLKPVAGIEMVAIQMAHSYCQKLAPCARPYRGNDEAMAIWWARPRCANGDHDHLCSQIPGRFLQRAAELLVAQAASGLCENFPRVAFCKSVPPVEITGLAFPVTSLQQYVRGSEDPVDALRGYDVVAMGANFTFAQDLAETPVYGITPGIHVQAMAFDNLVVLGKNVLRYTYPFGLSENAFLSIWIILCVFAMHSLSFATKVALKRRFKGATEHAAFLVEGATFLAALALLLLWQRLDSEAPANWVAASSAVGLSSAGETKLEKLVSHLDRSRRLASRVSRRFSVGVFWTSLFTVFASPSWYRKHRRVLRRRGHDS